MLPLDKLTELEAKRLSGVLFDLDDTLLTCGQLHEDAYSALFALQRAGLRLIAVTGRPASWAELCTRLWPIEATVAENGALAYRRAGDRVVFWDTVPPSIREARQKKLSRLVQRTRSEFPELLPADDVRGRISDYTFDIGEHERVPEPLIEKAVAVARAAGARTFRSSVHLHFSFDCENKATGSLRFLTESGWDPTSARVHFAYIGDSGNDAPCFAAFCTTIGVRNLSGDFSLPPRYQTLSGSGAGFVELAQRLCHLRGASASSGPAAQGVSADGSTPPASESARSESPRQEVNEDIENPAC